jgi:hypothetical protein
MKLRPGLNRLFACKESAPAFLVAKADGRETTHLRPCVANPGSNCGNDRDGWKTDLRETNHKTSFFSGPDASNRSGNQAG